jgi:hypothetical protein
MKQDQTSSFYDLRDDLPLPGCVVCRLKAESVDRFLDGLLWECVTDPEKRAEIRQARGFCREHFWRLTRPGAALGAAIITRDVLQNALRTMEDAASRAPSAWSMRRASTRAGLASRLGPEVECSACVWAAKMEDVYLQALSHNLLGEDGLLSAYESSDGLCLPHFRQALTHARDRRVLAALLDAQRIVWQRLVGHLDEFIRKSDYRFRDEAWGEERDAWLRAIAALAGTQPGQDD